MSPEASVLLLWLVLIQEGAAMKPVVTFTPNYRKIFTTESITMTCDVGSTTGEGLSYHWYKDNDHLGMGNYYQIQNAGTEQSGNYQCQTLSGRRSDPVRLDVSDGLVILQTPLYVYEGDELRLRCHHYPGYSGGRTRLLKDNRVIRDWNKNEDFYIDMDMSMAGIYKCVKEVEYLLLYHHHEDEVSVSVQELFPIPTIKVTQKPVFTKNMTLKCETSLPPTRQKTQLRFAFYREGRTVQGFGFSDIYEVYNVQLKDSGNYSCDIETTNDRVRKRSAEQIIRISELSSPPSITVTCELLEGDAMTLTCDTTISPSINRTEVQFAFYRDGRTVQGFNTSNKYDVQFAQVEDSGNYSCEVKSSIHNTMGSSDVFYIQIQELIATPTITVTPLFMSVGENMTLTCATALHPSRQDTQLRFAFYREGRTVQGFGFSDIYEVYDAQVEDSGEYSCEVVTSAGGVRKRSAERIIQISELIATPTITVTPLFMSEGENMTLTCATALHPSRQDTQLRFAFYREGRTVQGFGFSDIYEVYDVQVEDSGEYSCEVVTSAGGVRKRSAERIIQISGPTENIGYTQQNILRLTLSAVIGITAALFVFYHIKWIQSMKPEDDSTT